MNNLWLVIKREYLTRVRRRSFILATLLTPLGLALFFVVVQFIFAYENDEVQRIAVIDEGDLLQGGLKDENGIYFKLTKEPLDQLRSELGEEQEDGYTGILVVPKVDDPLRRDFRATYYSKNQLALDTKSTISNRLEKAVRRYKIDELQIKQASLDALDTDVDIRTRTLDEDAKETAGDDYSGEIGAAMGMFMGFLMYITVFVYGMMVMRSVMEEKSNRIVEVIISSVKPYTLMLGKIIGVGALGLTQVVAWVILIPGLIFLATILFGFDAQQPPPEFSGAAGSMDPEEAQSMVEGIIAGLGSLDWWVIIPAFFIYFLGGYFMYAALFAAVGSAMGDDLGEGQSLTIPITIPVILGFYIMIAAIQAPNSSLAVWSSMFPLFAPIVMPARLPFDPPWWQLVLSIVIMVFFVAGLIWVAGRIYRIGILNYGKKGSLKEMGKWMFSKD